MKLKDYRKAAKMTQSQLASKVDLTRIAIARYESGERRPSPEIAERIALVLKIPARCMWETFYAPDTQEVYSP